MRIASKCKAKVMQQLQPNEGHKGVKLGVAQGWYGGGYGPLGGATFGGCKVTVKWQWHVQG